MEYPSDENNKIYLLTDGCAWEINRQTGNEHPHAIEVVDLETGAVRYIKSGSRIKFIEGEISDFRTQESYNKAKKTNQVVSRNKQDLQKRTECKGKSELKKSKPKIKSL